MVISYFSATIFHLLLGDGKQRSPGQFQSAHNGLKPLEGQRRTVVVRLYYPVTDTEKTLKNTAISSEYTNIYNILLQYIKMVKAGVTP